MTAKMTIKIIIDDVHSALMLPLKIAPPASAGITMAIPTRIIAVVMSRVPWLPTAAGILILM